MRISEKEKQVLREAEAIYAKLAKEEPVLGVTSANTASDLFKSSLVGEEREHFEIAALDNQNRLIKKIRMFSGTVNRATVHTREVVKFLLEENATGAIIAHNHPSGFVDPSQADISMTADLKEALEIFDIRLLDHIIIGSTGKFTSLAQEGHL